MNIYTNYDYLKFESNRHSSFRMRDYLPNIQYSLDGETFNNYTPDELIDFENTLYIQWEGALFNNTTVGTLELRGEDIKVSGRLLHGDTPHAYRGLFSHCNNLVDASELVLSSESVGEYAYSEMFANCKQLTLVPELPATTLSEGCYSHMFYGCSSLIIVPELPATTLSEYCYDSMFSFCTSLTSVPDLIDTDVDFAYKEMFYGCTVLEDFLDLSDEQLNSYTYSGIFDKCTPEVAAFNLRNTRSVDPILQAPSTLLDTEDWLGFINIDSTASTIKLGYYVPTLSYSTDGVNFSDYTKNTTIDIEVGGRIYFKWTGALKTSYDASTIVTTSGGLLNVSGRLLHGGTQSSYKSLFYNSKQIKDASNILLPSTTLATYCYNSMFQFCTSLTTAPELPATTLASWCYSSMFGYCISLTTAPELPATTLSEGCYSGMFAYCYCTSLTTAPELPATTLAGWCYYGMFEGCFSLTTAPELPATTLSEGCYNYMFSSCSSLTTAPELPATTLSEGCYSGMFAYCSSLSSVIMLNVTAETNTSYIGSMFDGTPSTKVLIVPIDSTGYTTSWCNTTWAAVDSYLPTEEINYVLTNNGTLYTYSSNNKVEELRIPSEVTYQGNTYLVNKVSRNSLANDNKIKTLTIENGINKIEASALSGCNNLETVNIPESVTKIDNHAFWMCKNLKNIVLPSTLTKLKPEMFVACEELQEITIPDGITTIPFRMFEGCKNLTKVILPDTITEIQWSAFKDCVSLTEINIPDDCEVDDTAFEGTSI